VRILGSHGDILSEAAPVVADRQGSIKKFYPYGTERPSATANDTEKFTGYFRDASESACVSRPARAGL
jgi:hypothetical protein